MKDSLATPEDAIAAARGEGDPAMLDRLVAVVPGGAVGLIDAAEAYVAYQGRLREGNAADFGDLLLWPTLAMARSAVLRRRWASRFRSEEHTSELQSLMRISYAVFCLKNKKDTKQTHTLDKR